MPTDLIRFPGDLITADLWNKMLELIDGLGRRIDAQEALVVPDVVGDLFPTALGEIAVAQLTLNTVLDVDGTKGDPADASLASRTVIAQTPGGDVRVPAGTHVTLLITGPKAVIPTAPTVNKPAAGANAQVGQPLDITGTNFTGNIRVIIRTTQLQSSQFKVTSDKQIHIDKVPPFDGAPTPGTTKDIQITVGNEKGEGSNIFKFVEQAIPSVRPTITNIRLVDRTRLRLIGTNLNQPGQDLSLTIAGADQTPVPQSDGSLIISMPSAMATAYSKLTAAVFRNLQTLDQNDALMVVITTNRGITAADPGGQPALARAAVGITDLTLAGGLALLQTKMKLFLTMSATLAAQALISTVEVSGNLVRMIDPTEQTVFSVDVTDLQDFPVVVKIGDKSNSFAMKFGAIPDRRTPFPGLDRDLLTRGGVNF